MNYLGIDPGKTGAIALVRASEVLVDDTPLLAGDYDVRAMAQLVRFLSSGIPIHMVGIERQSPRPGEGVVSAFTTGRGFGLWIGIIGALNLPYLLLSPSVWKRALNLGRDKDSARAMAKQLFPVADLSLKKHHGRAEALLIAHYTKRIAQGGLHAHEMDTALDV